MAIQPAAQNTKLSFLPGQGDALEGEASALSSDTRHPMRIGLWTLGLGFGGFLLWAALAPLDEGVPAPAVVSIDTKRKPVQHLMGGIVKNVFVKEGQNVKQDDPLIALDDASMRANYESVRQHYLTLRAMEGRLLAEQAGRHSIDFHPDLKQAESDPYIRQTADNQTQLLSSRQQAYQADQNSIQESIQGQEATIQGAKGVLEARRNQLGFITEQLNGIRDLVKEGYAPRNQLLELERQSAELHGALADLQGNILRSQRSIAELKARAIQRTQEYRKEVDTQLADVRREVQADADKFKAVSADLARTTIRSPGEGQVVGLTVQHIGAVVAPGQKLMDVVPQHEALVLEAHVAPNLIDKIKAGLEVDVRFSAFAHTPALVVQGKVESVSADLLTDPATNHPYFLARVAITDKGMKELGKHQMQAGMPSEVIIKTGARSMLDYLLHPLTKRIAASLKEE
ncbi:MAG: HlyD family type I secretion periplasmic adaptor subunit [Sterolibacterium sp.]|nr:HlyD family type I secretion periplasmic adaptor subunit [Sterolibacterium sp.]MBP9799266.1 HlyD family type I secretion periplasmic adaptor subunit [Sterolibacterium sp.]